MTGITAPAVRDGYREGAGDRPGPPCDAVDFD